jgi:hypothetical protein
MPTIITKASGSASGFGFGNSGYYPLIPYQNILAYAWGYHMGGCYGTGVNNLYVQIGSKYGIKATATGWAADYTVASPGYIGNWSPSGNVPGGSIVTTSTLAASSDIVNPTTGFPVSSFTGAGQDTYADGRDTNAIRAITSWDGTNFTLTIQYDCKGGSNGWGTTLYSAIIPVVWTPNPF